jgi:hypothetical protein
MRPIHLAICTFVLLATMSAATSVRAAGYWNMPSTFCQCMGVGWGAGYHAPFVLGPIRCDGWCDHKEVRLPYAPVSPSAYCGHVGCDCGQPSRLDSAIAPSPAPLTMPPTPPFPTTMSPPPANGIFAPPFEQ